MIQSNLTNMKRSLLKYGLLLLAVLLLPAFALHAQAPRYYDTYAAMAADRAASGLCITNGYYQKYDGGGAKYVVRKAERSDVAGVNVEKLGNGLVAQLLLESSRVNIKTLGAKTDDPRFDNSKIIDKAMKMLLHYWPVRQIQAMHTNGGGTVYIPAGVYYCSSTIPMNGRPDITIEGDNRTTVELRLNGTFLKYDNTQGADLTHVQFLRLKELTFVGGTNAISAIAAHLVTVENCRFENMEMPLLFYLTVDVRVLGCYFNNCKSGVYVSGNAGVGPSTSFYVQNSYFAWCGNGIVLDFNRNYITQAVVSDCVLEYCNRMVVANGNSSKKSMIYLTHNHFEGARGSGKIAVELNNFSAQVSGNLFDENLKDVLSISSAAGNEIEVRDVKWNQVKFNGGNRGTILFESSDGRRLDTRR